MLSVECLQAGEGAYGRWLAADVVCHELGHQWFGDYVTCSDWDNIAGHTLNSPAISTVIDSATTLLASLPTCLKLGHQACDLWLYQVAAHVRHLLSGFEWDRDLNSMLECCSGMF